MKNRLKKISEIWLSILLVVTMIPVLQIAAATNLFQDIQKSDWFFDSVEYVNQHGLMKGTSETLFEPQITMSRAMFVTVLHRMEGEPTVQALTFKDVPPDTWFSNSVAWAAEEGIVNGKSKELFGPSDDVTREQIAALLYRYAEKKGYDVSRRGNLDKYVDQKNVSDWAKDALAWANAEGIIVGLDDGTLSSGANANRAQVAMILKRFCEGLQKQNQDSTENPADTPIEPPENKEEVIYTVTFDYNYDDQGVFKTVEVQAGEKAGLIDQPARTGYHFNGWYTKEGKKIDFEKDIIVSDLTVYAHWLRKSTGGNSGTTPAEVDDDRSFPDRLIEQMPKDKNWTISPYSLEMCLAMVANGAKGKTQEELLNVLQITDLEEYNSEIQDLLEIYDGFNRVMSLETANSIWINQDRFQGKGAFLKSFSELLSMNYRAEAKEVRDENSVEEINAWSDEKTHGKITRIMEEENRQFAVALANAVYFKAGWQNVFRPESTRPQTFYNLNGTESETAFMHQLDDYAYFEADGIQAVEIPYQYYKVSDADGRKEQINKKADFGMYILMSEKELDLQDFLNHADFHREKVRLTIPKFKIEYGDSLMDELKELGLLAVFDSNQADLSGIIDISDDSLMNNFYLDDVLQKAYLSVDEEGTEAAAVTVAVVKNGAALDPPPIYDFTADHPFYFVIRDNTSNRLLFAGKYNQVTE